MTVERYFWRFWIGGLAIMVLMIAINPIFINDVSPWGIRDHQSAGSAAHIDEIHSAWQAAGVMEYAQAMLALDLVYIAMYSFGAFCGGRMFLAAKRAALKWLGAIILAAAVVIAVADSIETICQLIQTMQVKGDNRLAGIAATVQPLKSTAFFTSLIAIPLALAVRKKWTNAA